VSGGANTPAPAPAQYAPVSAEHFNITQESITITKDKLQIKLMKNHRFIESRWAWVMPLGVFLSILIAFCTADFKKTFGVEAIYWSGLFIVIMIGSMIWLTWSISVAFRAVSIEDFIEKCKSEQ